MSNFVLSRVESVKIGAVDALEGACTSLGSIREVELTWTAERRYARSSELKNQRIEAEDDATEANFRIVAEEITKENLAYAMGATLESNDVETDGGGGAPTYYTLYVRGFKKDGSAALLHIVKAAIRPEGGLSLNAEQQVLEMNFELFANTAAVDYKLFAITSASADTTAPTVSSVSPADAATGVAVGANVVWTFSEAIMSDDVDAEHFFVFSAAGAVVAGALSYNAATYEVTFNPTSDLAAATGYNAVAVKGIRDLVGNQLAATSATQFTTA